VSKEWLIGLSLVVLALGASCQRSPGSEGQPTQSAEPVETRPEVGIVVEIASDEVVVDSKRFANLTFPLPRHTSRRIRVMDYGAVQLGIDEERYSAAWVIYRYDGSMWTQRPHRPLINWRSFQVGNRVVEFDTYKRSGWMRARMAPLQYIWEHWGQDAMPAAHTMANVLPQSESLYNGRWNALQVWIGELPKRTGVVWVCCGPIYQEDPVLYGGRTNPVGGIIPVPSHFFTIVAVRVNNELRTLAFIMSQESEESPLDSFLVAIDEIEGQTGIDFRWGKQEDEAAIETRVAEDMWELGEVSFGD
jgi:DNA/RNA endonuclease G (NUC1)